MRYPRFIMAETASQQPHNKEDQVDFFFLQKIPEYISKWQADLFIYFHILPCEWGMYQI